MKVLDENKLKMMADYINGYIRKNNGDSPRFSEILNYMNMSKSVGYRYLTRLSERGIVDYSGKRTLAVKGQDKMKSYFQRIPIYGSVICGTPEEEEQYNDGYLAIPQEWIRGDCFLLKARGDSMVEIGVNDGDLLLVQKTNEVVSGNHVIALTEDGNTFKTYYKETDGRIRLHPENKKYKDIYPKELRIQGKVIKVIKDLD